jgi:hypothetical protein
MSDGEILHLPLEIGLRSIRRIAEQLNQRVLRSLADIAVCIFKPRHHRLRIAFKWH